MFLLFWRVFIKGVLKEIIKQPAIQKKQSMVNTDIAITLLLLLYVCVLNTFSGLINKNTNKGEADLHIDSIILIEINKNTLNTFGSAPRA
ncbi:MAG: hypothetical protein IPH42_12965 [Bacteroidetes bacterium]|nr:hypothetical protein [Bacteroidota bacterium]